MSGAGTEAIDAESGVPERLLAFNRTLRMEGDGTPLDLLGGYDDYTNQDGPRAADVIHGVPVREVGGWRVTADVYVPHGDGPFPVMLWLHGGAWVMGAPATHRRLAEDLSAIGLLTVVIDYRRAPKHRFPAAVDDTAHALSWVAGHGSSLGGDPSRLFIGGDSAGGNLVAAALAVRSDDVPVAGAVLAYGIYDVHRALPLLTDLVGGPSPHTQLYMDPIDATTLVDDPRLHPERFCAGFPQTLVLSGDEDPLHGESVRLAEQLTRQNVPHRFHVAPGAPHGFLQLPTHPCHQQGLRTIHEFVTDVSADKPRKV